MQAQKYRKDAKQLNVRSTAAKIGIVLLIFLLLAFYVRYYWL